MEINQSLENLLNQTLEIFSSDRTIVPANSNTDSMNEDIVRLEVNGRSEVFVRKRTSEKTSYWEVMKSLPSNDFL
ncbi:MAG: hypothetical protein WBI40_09440 [Methylococcaceae bacterium]